MADSGLAALPLFAAATELPPPVRAVLESGPSTETPGWGTYHDLAGTDAGTEAPPAPPRPAPTPPPSPAAVEAVPAAAGTAATGGPAAVGSLPSHAHGVDDGDEVDWALVRVFRQQAAERLTVQLAARPGLGDAARRELGRALVVELLREHAAELVSTGGAVFGAEAEQRLVEAVFASIFGLGRLQPLVDDVEVENIEVDGCDQVHLVYADGRVVRGPAVADTDDELVETLAFLAARSGAREGAERSFSPARPFLDLTLPGGARLAARAWVTPRPSVVIRRHRLREVSLEGLRRLGMVDRGLAAFLSAAVRARRSVVVSGPQGSGKTTLVRALCGELDPLERIGTIETEYELQLHEMPHRHRRVVAHEARPGTGERGLDGRPAGEVTLDDLLHASLRMNLSRVIVGEVRGPEVLPMIKAMQAGAGSLSTVHAHSARAAIERLVTCALEAGPHVTTEFAHRQIADHVDLIVQLGLQEPTAGRPSRRYVSEVIEVGRGESGPAVTDVYVPGPDGAASPHVRPSFLPQLVAAGFDAGLLEPAAQR